MPTPPGFVRPDPAPGPSHPELARSNHVTLNDGSQRRYPTLDDYVQRYVALGLVADVNDLIENHAQYIAEIFFNWVRHGQLGCLFAVHLSKSPRENRWLSLVQLDALGDGNGLGDLLNAQLDAAGATHEAAAVIFPHINTEEDLVRLINALCSDPSGRWYRVDDGIAADPSGILHTVGLRWLLPSNRSVNHVLGFAPLETMPLTRRSPFTALFLRIKDDKRTPARREDGRVQVHLADLDSTFKPQSSHDRMTELTEDYRQNHVEPHMDRTAKARVTFSLSATAAAQLVPARSVALEDADEDQKSAK